MPYVDLPAVVGGAVITSAWGNQVRANFQAGAVDAMVAKGDLFVGTGVDAGARLAVGADDAMLVADSGTASGLVWQIQPAARVYNDAAIDPAPGNWVTLTFNTERFDTDAMHSTSTNTSRLTVPTGGDGIYLIGGNLELDSGGGVGSSDKGIRILLNGTTVIALHFNEMLSTGVDTAIAISTVYSLAATNYVELQVYTEGDVNVLADGNFSPEFWAIWQRRP